jgi:hypothetical protein
MNPLSIIQLVIPLIGPIESAIATATSNLDLVSKIKAMSTPLASILEGIGATLFPKAAPEIHIAGAVIAAFDPNFTKWLQGSLNSYLSLNPPLVVDGVYGAKTTAAVEQFQTKVGIKTDGLAGQVTEAALKALLTKVIPGVASIQQPVPAKLGA